MTKAAFDSIAEGLKDAIAFANGDTARGRVAAGPQIRRKADRDPKEPDVSAPPRASLDDWRDG